MHVSATHARPGVRLSPNLRSVFVLAKDSLGNGTNKLGNAKHDGARNAKPCKGAYD